MDNSEKNDYCKVLFVDDEENVLRALSRLFFDEPYEILMAGSGREGLEILSKNEIAVIISDQMMPEMDGARFLEAARKISPDSVRMVLTGHADISTAMDAINKGGAYRYITKPWNDNDIIITVKNAVQQYHLVKENIRLTELTRKQNEELKKWSDELECDVQQQSIDLTRQNQELQSVIGRVKNQMRAFITSISNLIELRNSSVSSHSNTVVMLSSEIAIKAGLSDNEVKTIEIAAQLHDIGKIGVSDVVLSKHIEELTENEQEDYRKHPVRGQSAVDGIEELRDAGILIRHHHECFNGSGFPDGLKEEHIPIGSRIISIADTFDRLYLPDSGLPGFDKTMEKMKLLSGIQFDPFYLHIAESAIGKKADIFIQQGRTFEAELNPSELRAGMVVSRDVRSGTGLLFIGKGMTLDAGNVAAIRRCYDVDPSTSGVYVILEKT
jgi:response regulator RpfG family c-di-GMP phosphodiesterase